MSPTIGVAITTRNRSDIRVQCLEGWRTHLPSGVILALVDDASNPPAVGATFRFNANVGVAAAKNKCFEILMDAGVDHLFLADDDVWPAVSEWWESYVSSPVPHLQHLWKGDAIEGRDGWIARNRPQGPMMYAERRVIERIGGMRTEFGLWGSEHGEWSRRTVAAGLNPHPYIDVVGSRELWHCLDRDHLGYSTLPPEERERRIRANSALRKKFQGTSDFVEYRRLHEH